MKAIATALSKQEKEKIIKFETQMKLQLFVKRCLMKWRLSRWENKTDKEKKNLVRIFIFIFFTIPSYLSNIKPTDLYIVYCLESWIFGANRFSLDQSKDIWIREINFYCIFEQVGLSTK